MKKKKPPKNQQNQKRLILFNIFCCIKTHVIFLSIFNILCNGAKFYGRYKQ